MRYQIFTKAILTVLLVSIISCVGKRDREEVTTVNTGTEDIITVPVETMVLKKNTSEASIPFTGIMKPISSVDIIAEVTGKVKKINKKLGHSITTDDVIAIIDDEIPYNQFQQALSQKLSAENNLKIGKLNLESDEILFSNNDISRIAYENSVLGVKTAEANLLAAVANLSLTKKNYDNTKITAPINGIISRDNIELGTMVIPGTVLYRVIDFRTLKIEIGISQDLVKYARIGSDANIMISALGNKRFNGTVKHISPEADEVTGTYKVEIQLLNTSDLEIRAGMTAKIDLKITDSNKQLTVPNYTIVTKAGNQYVYKIVDNVAILTKIGTGLIFGSNTVVTSGLKEDDMIVIVGMKNLGENTPVYLESTNK
ncbi:efflux RND transporter periplasmic adaptor subunit [Candidatus Neomarinimicrobiota bacterium]